MSTPQILQVSPHDLTLHSVVKSTPEWPNDDPRFLALVDDIRDRGIDQPVQVDSDMRIVDGRHRWRAAKRLQLDKIPIVKRGDHEVAGIFIGSILHRRHYTGGQRAYILAPHIASAFEEAHARRAANLPNVAAGMKRNQFASGAKTPQDWAAEIGVSLRYLQQANELRELFKDDKPREFRDENDKKVTRTFKEHFEPQILADEKPCGLGACIAGIRSIQEQERLAALGKKHKGGKPKELERQLELFCSSFKTLADRFEYWTNFGEEEKAEVIKPLKSTLEEMPEDLLEQWASAVRSEQRRRKQGGDQE